MRRHGLWRLVWTLTILLVIPATFAAAAEKVYINGIDANFPPFAFVDKSGNPDGFDVKALDWIAKDQGFQVKHQPMDWDGIVPSLKAKKIDIVASGMAIERAAQKGGRLHHPLLEDQAGPRGQEGFQAHA